MSRLRHLHDLPDVLEEMLEEYKFASFELRQKAVQKGAEVFKREIEAATPYDVTQSEHEHMRECWTIKEDYPNHRYVGNTKTAKGIVHRRKKNGERGGEARSGVPLSNVLEYAENSPHQGFIRRCFDSNETKIYEAMKKTMENGGN